MSFTLILVLTVAGFTEYKVVQVEDLSTCDRWGKVSVAAGEASSYTCYTSDARKA